MSMLGPEAKPISDRWPSVGTVFQLRVIESLSAGRIVKNFALKHFSFKTFQEVKVEANLTRVSILRRNSCRCGRLSISLEVDRNVVRGPHVKFLEKLLPMP